MVISPHLKAAFKLKLRSSGLTEDDAKQLHIFPLSAAATVTLHSSFGKRNALKLEYFGPNGKPLGSPPFYRIRFLDTPKNFSGKSQRRYSQPPKSLTYAYFPQNIDWSKVLESDTPIIITEGELKAAKATKEGFPTIGLGGVFNFQMSKHAISFLPELEAIDWAHRKVYIVYDSDIIGNDQVCLAAQRLTEQLDLRGALTHIVILPNLTVDGKTGLDDYLLVNSADVFQQLLDSAMPMGMAKVLWDLNNQVTYIEDPGLIITDSFQRLFPNAFKDHSKFSTLSIYERQLRSDGGFKLKEHSAAKIWLKWPLRASAKKLVYRPGAPLGRYGDVFNTWSGWKCEPKRGDVTPFIKLIDHLFSNDAVAKKWFLQWCAYPIQYPGTKMFTAVVLHGIRHGTGKSLIGFTLGDIYGKNFTEISQVDLHSNFNEWAIDKQLVMGDDVTGSNKRSDADVLKKMITQKEMRVNMKYIPSYTIEDCTNYLFTSNQPNAFFLDDDDRRFFVHEIKVGPLSESFYAEYDLWRGSEATPGAMLYYLLHLNTESFNPSAPALRTQSRDNMIKNAKSDLGAWVSDLRESPESVLHIGNHVFSADLFTSAQLLAIFDPLDSKRMGSAQAMGRELLRSGFIYAADGRALRPGSRQARYYIVRNVEKWKNAKLKEITRHLREHNGYWEK